MGKLIGVILALHVMASAQEPLELLNLDSQAPTAEDLNSPPVARGEKIYSTGICGWALVGAERTNETTVRMRVSYNGQRPVVTAFCWLDEIRSRFNAALRTDSRPETVGFVRTAQVEQLSNVNSAYNRMKGTYCSNGGTFYMDLMNQVQECGK